VRRAIAALILVLATITATAVTAEAAAVRAAAPAAPLAWPDADVTFTGHGWGHGRGLGQWGAYGYALGGSSFLEILAHYYGGTSHGVQANGTIGVRLVFQDGKDLVVTSDRDFTVGGVFIAGGSAGRITRSGGSFVLYTSYGCGQQEFPAGVIADPTARPVADPGDNIGAMLAVCDSAGRHHYRGTLRLVADAGVSRTVNDVPMESYLRGVVPFEASASWAGGGGGKGINALYAQAVAARSYAWSEQRYAYAKTCDTTSCQVYRGAGVNGASHEDARTDVAVANTAGYVRRFSNGTIARTEFSSSTGGYSAGGTFPAVVDTGDDISPFHNWSQTISVAKVEATYAVGALQSIIVTGRNGLGEDGGRVRSVVISGSSGSVTRTGDQLRSDLGLRSDWFSVASEGPPGRWYLRNTNTSGNADVAVAFGDAGAVSIACDWDGDGVDTVGVFQNGRFTFVNANASGQSSTTFGFGDPGDRPICGDWDGNGTDTVGLFRRGVFYLRNSNSSGPPDGTFGFGNPTDVPLAGNWNADPWDTVAVFRDGVMYYANSNLQPTADGVARFGNPGDRPLVGDWNGDDIDTLGVRRSATFYLGDALSGGVANRTIAYGDPTDVPVRGDWNGDGVDTIGVSRGI
jgi:SpoIID/LytB domain protein